MNAVVSGDFLASIYTNVVYPFTPDPPNVPEDNQVGVYFRRFEAPADHDSRRSFLSFQSIDTCGWVYLNGTFVGYSEDAKLPADFEITDHLHAGERDRPLCPGRRAGGTSDTRASSCHRLVSAQLTSAAARPPASSFPDRIWQRSLARRSLTCWQSLIAG